MNTHPSNFFVRLGRCWPLFGLVVAGLLILKGSFWPAASASRAEAASTAGRFDNAAPAFRNIEDIRVGQRVVTDLPDGILDLDGRPFDRSLADGETRVDPATWRLVRMRAEEVWADGTVDDINIETLQPLEWIEAHQIRVGHQAPIPLDLVEMGLPENITARVLAIEPCPKIEQGRGPVVLTTVNHLSPSVLRLVFCSDSHDEMTEIQSTAHHRFYSVMRQEWLPASELAPGETLIAHTGQRRLASRQPILEVYRVYNMTVESLHAYRVSEAQILVHNNRCTPDQQALIELVDETTLGGRRPLSVDQAGTVLDWADEVGMPGVRASPTDVTGAHGPFGPHIHIPGAGRSGHVPVQPGVPPRP